MPSLHRRKVKKPNLADGGGEGKRNWGGHRGRGSPSLQQSWLVHRTGTEGEAAIPKDLSVMSRIIFREGQMPGQINMGALSTNISIKVKRA